MRRLGTYVYLWREVPEWARATYGRLAENGYRKWAREKPPDTMYGWNWPIDSNRCPAAIEYFGEGLFYPCQRRPHDETTELCWAHRGGRRGGDVGAVTRKRTIMTTEEVTEHDPPKVEIRVSLGEMTLGQVKAALSAMERAAVASNAPPSAGISFDTYAGETVARVSWELPR